MQLFGYLNVQGPIFTTENIKKPIKYKYLNKM